MARYKLLYIWVNDNDRLKNKEFHFNSKFHFSFNMKSCELSVTGPETSYIDGFYSIENETDNSESPNQEQGGFDPIENETDSSKSPNQEQNFNSIIDFSAIVGNNAVGKTTLLNLIHKYASKIGGIEKDAPSNFSNYELSQLFSHQIIMVYLDLDSIEKPLYAIPYNVKVTNSGRTITIIEKLPGLRPQTVYLTNTFNYSDYVKAQHFHDDFNLATGYLMFSFAEPHKTEFTTDPIIRFEHKEILRQSAVIRSVNEDKNFSDALKKIGLNIPKRTVFVLKHYHWDGNDFPGIDFDLESPEERDDLRIKAVNLKESLNTCAKHSYSNLGFPNNDNANITINLCHVLIQSLIVSISKAESSISKNVLIISHEYWKDYSSIIESHYKEIEDAVAFVKSYFKKLQNDFKYKDVVSTIIDNHMNFLDVFIKWIDHRFDTHDSITPQICIRTPNYISRTDFEDLDLEDYHYTSKNDLFSVTLFGVSIEEFIKEYDKISSYFASFSFSWEGLSSGESAFLSLFGRLFSIREKIIGNNNLILLLDEADMLFHPEWQRNYIEILHKVIPIIFPNKNIQVILATHSPLMLSDIPKQNTLFLQKDKDTGITEAIEGEDTFAANIFSLLRNAFFLEKCGMGEYSFNKIEWLINQIHNPKANPKEIFKYIDSVGDPYLKDKLLLEYNSKLNESKELSRLKKEKAMLEAKIAKLESGNLS